MQGYIFKSKEAIRTRIGVLGMCGVNTLARYGGSEGPDKIRAIFKEYISLKVLHGERIADIERYRIADLAGLEIADFGNVRPSQEDREEGVQELAARVREILDAGCFPLLLGGDHSNGYPPIRALHDSTTGRVGIIQLDAHPDLMDAHPVHGRYSGSSPMRRALELPRIRGSNLVQVGLRGHFRVGDYEFGKKEGVRVITSPEFRRMGPVDAAHQALGWAGEGTEKIYLTLDVDVMDAPVAPGSGFPEPAGLASHDVIEFVREVAPRVHAMDIVEVNPMADVNDMTAMTAVRIMTDLAIARHCG